MSKGSAVRPTANAIRRGNSRNGYHDRTWETRTGASDLRISKPRNASGFPAFLEPRRTAEESLADAFGR